MKHVLDATSIFQRGRNSRDSRRKGYIRLICIHVYPPHPPYICDRWRDFCLTTRGTFDSREERLIAGQGESKQPEWLGGRPQTSQISPEICDLGWGDGWGDSALDGLTDVCSALVTGDGGTGLWLAVGGDWPSRVKAGGRGGKLWAVKNMDVPVNAGKVHRDKQTRRRNTKIESMTKNKIK